ncbi:unnamed protein product [Cuscuta campestris]|uniref:Uncharacterized protein n=1 Tax=Cuscuta campestris TaxID=132261 RepID=A0A484MC80_9ASTE|nr:unnamed protein product [Cuscuta campestris]
MGSSTHRCSSLGPTLSQGRMPLPSDGYLSEVSSSHGTCKNLKTGHEVPLVKIVFEEAGEIRDFIFNRFIFNRADFFSDGQITEKGFSFGFGFN